jgi:hypothetical protein
MISKCANPGCSARFLYLHTGKLYRIERENRKDDTQPLLGFGPDARRHTRSVEFFWLCEKCASSLTLVYCRGVGVTTHPLHPLLKAAS